MFAVSLVVGLAYYAGAWIGVNQNITLEGVSVVWPANAIVLAAFLVLPWRHWPGIAVAVMAAEIFADLPAFPLWAAIAFGFINLSEAALAAFLIKRVASGPFNFDNLRNGGAFLIFGPLVASTFAGMLGASVYVVLARADTSFVALWQLWWFGDALGLLLITPLVVASWRWLENGLPDINRARMAELTLLWLVIIWVSIYAFKAGEPHQLTFFVNPAWLAPLAIIAALRLGVVGAASTVALIALLAVGYLVNDIHPYVGVSSQYAVWLTQEYLAALALVVIGLAILMKEITDQRQAMLENERAIQRSNAELEQRVRERTLELERANQTLEEVNRRLVVTAATDELTGMANRRHIYAEAARELSRLRRDGSTASVIMIDLDHFKDINDSLGHEAGDTVLRAIQEPVRQCLRPRDLVGRIGGEEFLIMLSGEGLSTAVAVAERVRLAIEETVVESQGRRVPVTASLGVAQWDGQSSLDSLVHSADQALYLAKQNGRNRVEGTLAAETAGTAREQVQEDALPGS